MTSPLIALAAYDWLAVAQRARENGPRRYYAVEELKFSPPKCPKKLMIRGNRKRTPSNGAVVSEVYDILD